MPTRACLGVVLFESKYAQLHRSRRDRAHRFLRLQVDKRDSRLNPRTTMAPPGQQRIGASVQNNSPHSQLHIQRNRRHIGNLCKALDRRDFHCLRDSNDNYATTRQPGNADTLPDLPARALAPVSPQVAAPAHAAIAMAHAAASAPLLALSLMSALPGDRIILRFN